MVRDGAWTRPLRRCAPRRLSPRPERPHEHPVWRPDLPARGPGATAVGRHHFERVGGHRGARQEHGTVHSLPCGRTARFTERALCAGDLPGSRRTPVDWARPGSRPLRPGLEDVLTLSHRRRRQRAAGDGDAGGLPWHLLGGHGEGGAVPLRQGRGHVSQLHRLCWDADGRTGRQTTRSSPRFSSNRLARSGRPATAEAWSASTWPAGERSATCPIHGAPIR